LSLRDAASLGIDDEPKPRTAEELEAIRKKLNPSARDLREAAEAAKAAAAAASRPSSSAAGAGAAASGDGGASADEEIDMDGTAKVFCFVSGFPN
jgi:hypothetical protein